VSPQTSLARQRKLLLDHAAEHGVTETARLFAVSRSWLYELRARYQRYGEVGLRPRPKPERRDPRRLSVAVEDAIVSYAITHPTHGPRRIADNLRLERYGAVRVSHGSASNVLARHGLGKRSMRLAAAELRGLEEGGPITERALRELRARERRETLHLGSDELGGELFLDTMYVGKLKGVGPVWQFAAIDGACSFAVAQALAGEKRQQQAIAFVVERVLPIYAEIAVEIKQITTDRGPEFGRAFRQALAEQGIRHRRLPPRSPNLNSFVERLHGTILHEHYRIAFRLRYYTSAADVDADLQGYLRHYNFERPHRGRRLHGATPASRFYQHAAELLTAKGW
jgi:transposase InsO family protein